MDHHREINEQPEGRTLSKRTIWYAFARNTWKIITWIPPRCRWSSDKPPKFHMSLNILFAFASAFAVGNLYYSHPILNVLAHDFGISYEDAARIPTLMQAGYAVGLFFLCPLGDLLRRRAFVLCLILLTASLWIILCLTNSFITFQAISFIVAVSTVTPQIMLPLVADLAPPNRRASALSIVVSGFALGILVARTLSGIITNFTSWRNVYWMSCGLQYTILILLWMFMPDYPSKNPGGLNYFKMLWSHIPIICRNPVLVQASLISFFNSATFTSFWTTLTFLLSGSPYHYSPLVVGLFGLIGIAGMLLTPLYARFVTDRFVPLFSVGVGCLCGLVGISIGTYIGTFTVAGPILQALFNDFGMQTAQVANRNSIYSIEPNARNRVNVVFMLGTFMGQLTGTAAGNHLYARGGWIRSGSGSIGFICASIFFCLIRGPYETGWIGWSGGYSMKKKDKSSADGMTAEKTHFYEKDDVKEKSDPETGPSSIEKALDEIAAEEYDDSHEKV